MNVMHWKKLGILFNNYVSFNSKYNLINNIHVLLAIRITE